MLSRRTSLALAGALTTTLALAGCGDTGSGSSTPEDAELTIVASTNVYGSIAEAVAGDAAEVTSIIDDPSADPHSFEADTRTQLALSRATVVVANGGGYDDFVDTMLNAADNPDVTLINAVDVSGKDTSGEFNEHVWYDVDTVRAVAQEIESALAAASPDDAQTFEANRGTFEAGLDTLQEKISNASAATSGKPVAITEPVPGYLLDALGAVDETPEAFSEAIEEETDVPVDVLQETLALFTTQDVGSRVQALVYNEQTTGPQTEQVLTVARDNAVAVVPVTETLPDGKDYTTWMTENVDAIATALGA